MTTDSLPPLPDTDDVLSVIFAAARYEMPSTKARPALEEFAREYGRACAQAALSTAPVQGLTDEQIDALNRSAQDAAISTGVPPHRALVRAALAAAPHTAAQPVARVDSWANGSYGRNYRLTWLKDVPEGSLLYAAPVVQPMVPAGWKPIETAPRGSGEDGPSDTRHPDYVVPPKLLLWTQEGPVVGYYDWYYHPGYGRGADHGESVWRDHDGGRTYGASHWMPLPAAPASDADSMPAQPTKEN